MKKKSKVVLMAGGFVFAGLAIVGVYWRSGRLNGRAFSNGQTAVVVGRVNASGCAKTMGSGTAAMVSLTEVQPVEMTERVSAELMTAARLKLKQWRETETGAEAVQGRLVEEWLALLNGATVGDVVLALSEEELSTPLGVAAFGQWLKAEPDDALEWIKARKQGSEGETLLVVQALLDAPARLPTFCEQLSDSEWKQTFLTMAALQAVAKDPALALDLAKRMEPGAAQTNVLQTFAYDWMTRDPGGATTWLLTVEDPGLKESLFAAGAKAIAVTDPDLAVRWMSAGIKTVPAFVDTALCVVEIWAERDPVKAGGWVAQFPPGQARDLAVDLMSRRWLQADASAAREWIRRLPEGAGVLAKIQSEESARAAAAGE